MPFKSEKQRRFMFANHPAIAHKWAHETSAKRSKSRRSSRKSGR